MADRLASAGYTVLVPNVFYRSGRTPLVELPDFINPAERPEIIASLRPAALSLIPEAVMRDAAGHLDWLARSPPATDGKVGVTGYCMGAGLALRTAGARPDRVAAAAGFHGAFLATAPRTALTSSPSSTSATPTRKPASPRPNPHHGGRPPSRRGDGPPAGSHALTRAATERACRARRIYREPIYSVPWHRGT